MRPLRHPYPYTVGDRVKALWIDKVGTCLVMADVTGVSIDPARRGAPYGITLTHDGTTISVWVRANGTDIHQYIAPARG